jgi:CDP-diacylglycerol---serine O-phosphatidyltransferase
MTIFTAMKLFTIPNIITLLNLLCGCLAIVCAFDGSLVWSAYLVGIAAVLDFLDGFLARLLKQYSEIGKQLDSLADMVTFGVVPAIVMFKLLKIAMLYHYPFGGPSAALFPHANQFGALWTNFNEPTMQGPLWMEILPYCAFLIALFSCLRLAKFNIDTRQSDSFIGVPTPANSILICSIPLILRFSGVWTNSWPNDIGGEPSQEYVSGMFTEFMRSPYLMSEIDMPFMNALLLNPWVLIGITVIMSVLLIAEIPLFALKFKSFGWKGNEIRWSFLGLAVALLATLQFVGIPLAIVLYILMSVGNNLVANK